MQTSVTFKNLDPSEHLKSYVKEKLNKFDKFFDNPAEAKVVLSVKKSRHIAEIKLLSDKLQVNSKEETHDMYPAIDLVLSKLEKQVKKNKQKQKIKTRGFKARQMGNEFMRDDHANHAETAQYEIIDKPMVYMPIDVNEAIMQMKMSDTNFFVFTNIKTDKVNVLRMQDDDKFELIQPKSNNN
jgi:putative sigma-54 modulation protein